MLTEVNGNGGRTVVMKRTFATLEASKIDYQSFRGSGRILEYDVYTKQTIVLMAKLNFPNGIVIKKTEEGKTTLVFSETMRARLIEIDLTTDEASYEPLKLWKGKGFDHKGGL